jgi:hypothetical protein
VPTSRSSACSAWFHSRHCFGVCADGDGFQATASVREVGSRNAKHVNAVGWQAVVRLKLVFGCKICMFEVCERLDAGDGRAHCYNVLVFALPIGSICQLGIACRYVPPPSTGDAASVQRRSRLCKCRAAALMVAACRWAWLLFHEEHDLVLETTPLPKKRVAQRWRNDVTGQEEQPERWRRLSSSGILCPECTPVREDLGRCCPGKSDVIMLAI